MKLKEYAASGLPTLVPYGVHSELYTEEQLVFVELEPGAISERLEELRAQPQHVERYRTHVREIASEWRWADVAEEYATMFETLVT